MTHTLRYKGATLHRVGVSWYAWTDFVTEFGYQKRFDSLAKAKYWLSTEPS